MIPVRRGLKLLTDIMVRLFVTLLTGAALGLAGESFLTRALPMAPLSVRSAAASMGIQEKAVAAPVNYALTGPLSGSLQAETNKNTMRRFRRWWLISNPAAMPL